MDRGYMDFGRLHALHEAGAFFVTRAKSNLKAHRVYSGSSDRTAGVIADQAIALDGYRTRQDYPQHLRRIRFKDPESGKRLVFLTNQTSLPALTICALYKSRWQVDIDQAWRLSRINQWVGRFDLQRGHFG
jgi:Transposase DDE domain